MLGRECTRQLWYMGRNAHRTNRVDAASMLAMRQGESNEPIVTRLLHSSLPGEVQTQVPIPDPDSIGCAEGTCDGLTDTHVIEIKRTGLWRFLNIAKEGLENGDFSYYAQCQLYMKALGRDRCYFIMVSADYSAVRWQWKRTGANGKAWRLNGEIPPAIWVEELELDEPLVKRLIARARALTKRVDQVTEARQVPREFDPNIVGSGWPCGWCAFRRDCATAGEASVSVG